MVREVIPFTGQHLEEAARALGQAFLNDPGWLVLFEGLDEEERKRRMTWVFAASLSACLRTGSPLEVRDQDRLVAAATVYQPRAYPQPVSQQVTILAKSLWHAGPFKRNTWTIMKRSLQMLDEMSKEHPAEVHCYLEYIGVTPDSQGRGIGSLLAKSVLQKADQEHVGCYLETANPRTVPLYRRLGFRTVREKEIMGVPMWFMWRDPERPLK